MQIYNYLEFRPFLREWIQEQPKAGRGILRAWAKEFSVHPTLLSQILSGKRNLSFELAHQIGEKINLSENEANYLLQLVLYDQAGTVSLKKKLRKNLEETRARSQKVSERLQSHTELSEENKSTFYSTWIYSGIRNLTAIPAFQSVDSITRHLGLPRDLVAASVELLINQGLCIEEKGRLKVGPQRTYVPPESPLAQRHHQNWRLQGFNKMPLRKAGDLFLTVPMSLSEADAEKLRAMIPAWFEEVNKLVSPSASETVRCLNIDFFGY